MEKLTDRVSLIYFDADQYKDYLENPIYNDAYNKVIEEMPIFIWCGDVDGNINGPNTDLIVYNEQGEKYSVNLYKQVVRILVRGRGIPDFVPDQLLVNSRKLNRMINNKRLTKIFLRKRVSPSVATENSKVLIEGQKYVLKPVDGLKGEGILISKDIKKINETEQQYLRDNIECIIEPFIEGVPFRGHKTYDIRVVFSGRTPVLTMLRIPAEGSELANLAQGGSKEIIDFKELPPRTIEYLKKISIEIRNNYGLALFSVDFNIVKGNYINVFELNSYPGIRPEYELYLKHLNKMLIPPQGYRKHTKSAEVVQIYEI